MSAMTDDLTDRRVDIMLAGVRGAHATESGWHYGQDAYERAIFRAAYAAGMRAGIERAAEACDDRAIVYDGLEDAASTRYFADKMRGAREGSEQCAAAIRALVEGKP